MTIKKKGISVQIWTIQLVFYLSRISTLKITYKIMATIKFVILPAKPLKNGSYRIKLAVSHRTSTSYISTRFSVQSPHQFSCGQVIEHPNALTINRHLRAMMDAYEERLYNIENIHLYTCQQIAGILSRKTQTSLPTFGSVTNDYLQELESQGRHNYALLLERNNRYMAEFVGYDIPLEQIDESIIRNFMRELRLRGMGDTSINMHLSRTRTIINRGIKLYYVHYDRHPLANIKIQQSPERELDITKEQFIRLRDCTPSRHKLVVARDMFCLSYYLAGMNLVDMITYDFRNTDRIDYTRFKTRNQKQGEKRISFTIQPEAWPIIHKYMNKRTGKLDLGYQFSYNNLSRYITRNLHALDEELHLHANLCYYSARKSFVQHGFDIGISLEVLEYCVGQSIKKNRPIFNYLRIMRKHADEAIRKVLDNLQ